jgi:hypothetical protein
MAAYGNKSHNNYAGALVPQFSQWGQALKHGTPQLIDQPTPIGTRRHNFGGTVGAMATVSASVMPIFTSQAYWGDIPQNEQGTVDAPPPWERV